MMKKGLVKWFWAFVFLPSAVVAQTTVVDIDSLLQKYTFINTAANRIENDSTLYDFFLSLKQLEKTQQGTVSIAHIGDSHIQAGALTKPVRERLQGRFGNAGRGLIFPYQVARTNGPADFTSYSNIKWNAKRNAYNNSTLPTGLAGHSIYSTDSSAIINLQLKGLDTLYTPFTRVTLFHNSICDSNYCYRIMDTAGRMYLPLSATLGSSDSVSEFVLEGPHPRFTILHDKQYNEQQSSLLYAMLLRNGFPGVLYHSIGVNGAEYRTYLNAEKFTTQIASLQPSLIILAMGTNEAYNAKNFQADSVRQQVNALITSLQQQCPQAKFIISVLPESLKGYRVKRRTYYRINPNVAAMRNILVETAAERKLAWWDLYTIMGGEGSMVKWHAAGMTDSKRIHFSPRGYQLQGELLYRALQESYDRFLQNNP